MPIVASLHAFLGGRGCRLETCVPRVVILKPKQEVWGKEGLVAVPKAKLGLALLKSLSPPPSPPPFIRCLNKLSSSSSSSSSLSLSLSRPQGTRTLSLVASDLLRVVPFGKERRRGGRGGEEEEAEEEEEDFCY